jgi:hypothetical protein
MSQKEKENIAIHQKGQRTFSSYYFSSPRWEINKKAPEPVLRFLRNQSITKTKEELYISFRRRRRETTSRDQVDLSFLYFCSSSAFSGCLYIIIIIIIIIKKYIENIPPGLV